MRCCCCRRACDGSPRAALGFRAQLSEVEAPERSRREPRTKSSVVLATLNHPRLGLPRGNSTFPLFQTISLDLPIHLMQRVFIRPLLKANSNGAQGALTSPRCPSVGKMLERSQGARAKTRCPSVAEGTFPKFPTCPSSLSETGCPSFVGLEWSAALIFTSDLLPFLCGSQKIRNMVYQGAI